MNKYQKRIAIIFNVIFTMFIFILVLIRIIYPLETLQSQIVMSFFSTGAALIFGLCLFDLMESVFKRIVGSEDTDQEYKMELETTPARADSEIVFTKLEAFGKDHFSLLIYVESRCVDHNGVLDIANLRVNSTIHPLFNGHEYSTRATWNEKFGTLLNTGERLVEHDDIDCLDDLDNAGLIEIISLVNGFMSMTDKGNELVSKIRSFKAEGGHLKDFSIKEGDIEQ